MFQYRMVLCTIRYRDHPYPTWWTSVADLTNRIFYFYMTHNLNVIWVTLKDVDFSAGRPMRVIDPAQIDLVGDVTKKFVPVPAGK